MIAKLIALLSLSVLQLIVTLSTYWFVFGLWPQSWLAFVFFGCAQAVVMGLIQVVAKVQ